MRARCTVFWNSTLVFILVCIILLLDASTAYSQLDLKRDDFVGIERKIT